MKRNNGTEMKQIDLEEHELSGARLTIPFTILGNLGPKHHAVIVGFQRATNQLWIAELSRKYGHRLVSLDQWFSDNKDYVARLKVQKNSGPKSNAEVAQSAIDEIVSFNRSINGSKYNLVFNNCETFVDRHTDGEINKIKLSPQVTKALKTAGIVLATGAVLIKKTSKRS